MSQHDSDGSFVLPGKQRWDRVRHFHDERESAAEWQCSDCHLWYPQGSWHGISIRKGRSSQPWCFTCRPPQRGLLKHLHEGGGVSIGFGGFTERIKKQAAERRAAHTTD